MDELMATKNAANDFPDRSDSATEKVRPYLKNTTVPIVASNFTVDSSELVAVTIKVPVVIQSWPVQQREPSSSHLVTGKKTHYSYPLHN